MKKSDNWPDFNRYGSPKHLAAIGAISAIWNDLEALTKGLISLLLENKYELTDHITEKLSIDEVVSILKINLLPLLNEETQDNLTFYIECTQICKENRNTLLHSIISADYEGEGFIAAKGMNRQRTAMKQRNFSLEQLRAHADEMFDILQYGWTIFYSAINYIEYCRNKNENSEKEFNQKIYCRPKVPSKIILSA
jgi:hypothetical protein